MITYTLQVEYKSLAVAFLDPVKRLRDERHYRTSMDVKRAVACAFGVTMEELVSHSRLRAFSWPRFAAYHLIRSQTRLSLPQIGRYMGGRDHATIIHGIGRCEALLNTNPDFSARYEEAKAA